MLLPIAWLAIVLDYTGRRSLLSQVVPVFGLWALVSIVVIWTDSTHDLFRQSP